MSQLKAHSSHEARWHRRKEDRPAEILCSALENFSEKGFAATRLDDVAKAAGVSKGTLYLYFESKEALFKAVINEFVVPHIIQAEQHADNFTGSIANFFRQVFVPWYAELMKSNISAIPKLIISEAGNFPEIADFYTEHVIKRGRRFIASLIQKGIDQGEFRQCNAEMHARTFLAPLVLAAIWECSLSPYDEGYELSCYFDTHLETFLRGIEFNKNE